MPQGNTASLQDNTIYKEDTKEMEYCLKLVPVQTDTYHLRTRSQRQIKRKTPGGIRSIFTD